MSSAVSGVRSCVKLVKAYVIAFLVLGMVFMFLSMFASPAPPEELVPANAEAVNVSTRALSTWVSTYITGTSTYEASTLALSVAVFTFILYTAFSKLARSVGDRGLRAVSRALLASYIVSTALLAGAAAYVHASSQATESVVTQAIEPFGPGTLNTPAVGDAVDTALRRAYEGGPLAPFQLMVCLGELLRYLSLSAVYVVLGRALSPKFSRAIAALLVTYSFYTFVKYLTPVVNVSAASSLAPLGMLSLFILVATLILQWVNANDIEVTCAKRLGSG